jgi:CRP/FNR family transcriptional regulator, transcriptional activator FtrB
VDIQFYKRMLASQLGMAPENLSRNLAFFGKHGIRSTGRRIYVEDSHALERFAKPNALIAL